MSFLLPFLYLCGLTGAAALLFRRRFEEALIVYVSGVCGSLLPGYYVSIAAAAACPLLLAVRFLRDRARFRADAALLFTPGEALFAAVYLLLYVMNYQKGLVWWDEYSHWAPVVKILCGTDALYCRAQYDVYTFLHYPPMLSIVEYLWCRLSGGYAEQFLYRALGMFTLALFFPAFRNLRWEWKHLSAWVGAGLALAVLFLGMEALSPWFFSMVYVDGALGVLFAYCMAAPLLDGEPSAFRTVKLCAGLAFLVLTKVSAVFFAALVLAFLLVLALGRRHASPQRVTVRGALRAAVVVLLPVAAYVSWNAVLRSCGLQAAGNGALETLRAGLQPYQRETIGNFLRALVTTPLLTRPFPLSFVPLTAVFAALYVGLSRYCKESVLLRRMYAATGAMVAGALLFAAALLMTYLLSFSATEATRLASYTRYMSTYFTGMLALGVMLFLYANGQKRAQGGVRAACALAALALVLFLCVPDGAMKDLKPQMVDLGVSQRYEGDAAEVTALTGEDAHVLFIAQGDVNTIMDGYVLCYLALPRNADFIAAAVAPGEGESWVQRRAPEDLLAYMIGFDAVYLYHVDEAFVGDYADVFPDVPEDGALYTVMNGALMRACAAS